eukprot:1000472-Rhodomonas_salina.5
MVLGLCYAMCGADVGNPDSNALRFVAASWRFKTDPSTRSVLCRSDLDDGLWCEDGDDDGDAEGVALRWRCCC